MIFFEHMRFKNLGSFGAAWTDIDLGTGKSTLVSGENGHGKSYAFQEILTFALFGKPFRPCNIPQLLNSINKKQGLVEVKFRKGKTEYMVRRGLGPKLFEVFRDGVLLDQTANSKDYQEQFEETILGFNIHAFKQVVMLGKASFVPFMQLTPVDRRKIVENLLGLGVLAEMATVVKATMSTLRTTVSSASQEIALTGEKLASLESAHRRMVQDAEKEIQERTARRDVHVARLQELTESREGIQADLEAARKRVAAFRESESKETQAIAHYKAMERNLVALEKQVSEVSGRERCPSCNQKMTDEARKFCLGTREEQRDELGGQIAEARGILLSLHEEVEATRSVVQEYAALSERHGSICADILVAQRDIAAEDAEIRRLGDGGDGGAMLLQDIASTRDRIRDAQARLDAARTEQRHYEVLAEILKDGGLKAKIIRQYIPVINRQVNDFLSKLNLHVEFQLDENFSETIKSRYRDEFSYTLFSEGEKQRIDLAILLTWREIARMKNSLNCNLLVFDEILDSSLDARGSESFLKLLGKMKGPMSTFIISHKTEQLADKFDRHLVVQKKNNFSKILVNA